MIIGCDIDGVLADVHTEQIRRYNRDYNDNLGPDVFKTWDMVPYVKPECGDKIYNYFSDPDLYEYVPLVKDCQAGIEALKSKGHEIVYITANTRGMCDQKWDWMIRHGFIPKTRGWPQDLIVSNAKWRINADILIDDKDQAVVDWIEKRQKRAILFSQPWNSGIRESAHSMFWQWAKTARNWKHVVEVLNG